MKGLSAYYRAAGLATLISLAMAGVAHAQDTSNPTVGSISPTTTAVNISTAFSATYSDNTGVTSCDLWVNGANQGAMTLSGTTSGTATRSHTLTATGNHTLQARCSDAAGNVGLGAETTVTAVTDTTAPTVSAITPTSAQVGVSTEFSATFSDNVAVASCTLFVNGANQGAMTLSGSMSGTATKSFSLSPAGTYTLQARCSDTANNEGQGTSTTVTVPPPSESTLPSVSGITPTSAQVNAATTFTATYSDNTGVTSCDLWVDSANQGAMTLSGTTSGTATKSFTLTSSGSHTLQARCADAAGNVGVGTLTTVTATVSGPDVTAPSVSGITPTGATLGASTTFSATYSDSTGVTSCDLYLDGANQGAMSLSGSTSGTATRNLTLSANGTYTLHARCRDAAGNVGIGASTTVSVPAPSGDTTPPFTPTNLRVVSQSGGRVTLQWDITPDNVGTTGYQVSVDGGVYVDIGNFLNATVGPLSTGTHTFGVRARDAAGNLSGAATVSFSVSAAAPAPGPLPTFTLERMLADAVLILEGSRASLESSTGRTCELADADARARVQATLGSISNQTTLQNITNFMACGTISTLHLGAGERLGVVNSYRAAFNRLPETNSHWFDVTKIANGRFPGEISATAEANAKARFRTIYLREPNMSAAFDANAVVIMAYGLRPLPRSLSSEATAIGHFKAIFGHTPSSATDWDAVRAIAYSGASR